MKSSLVYLRVDRLAREVCEAAKGVTLSDLRAHLHNHTQRNFCNTSTRSNLLRLMPALNLSQEDSDTMLAILEGALRQAIAG